jgi:hypothetical protein
LSYLRTILGEISFALRSSILFHQVIPWFKPLRSTAFPSPFLG